MQIFDHADDSVRAVRYAYDVWRIHPLDNEASHRHVAGGYASPIEAEFAGRRYICRFEITMAVHLLGMIAVASEI